MDRRSFLKTISVLPLMGFLRPTATDAMNSASTLVSGGYVHERLSDPLVPALRDVVFNISPMETPMLTRDD